MSKVEDKTLCQLQEQGYFKTNTEDFIKLTRPASYFCKNCGQCAVNSENLCNPENLN